MIRKHSSGLIVRRMLSAAVMFAVLSLAACAPGAAVPGTNAPTAVPATAAPPTEAKAQANPTDQDDTCQDHPPAADFFDFPEDAPNAQKKFVTRKTIITAPTQNGNPISIKPLELPGDLDHPESAKANAEHPVPSTFGFWVISPEVCDMVKMKVLTEFKPPLAITVTLKEGDLHDGKFSLFVAAQKDNVWKTQILTTTLITEGTTLLATAPITTTAPSDPVGGGFP